jgi:UDP-N-acetylmuramoylalanine--D-glutamate ligase
MSVAPRSGPPLAEENLPDVILGPGSAGDLAGLRVTVVGMGASGQAAAALLLARGATVTCTDRGAHHPAVPGARCVFGHHDEDDFFGADLLVVSPGVPAQSPLLAAAAARGVPRIGELGLAAALLQARGLPLVAITGTNGKSTTTWFCAQLLDMAGLRCFRGGNLGTPLSVLALALLRGGPVPDGAGGLIEDGALAAAVVEVSSYQLELPGPLRPVAAAVLNLTPDHLARHGDMAGYAAAKLRLLSRLQPDGLALLPAGDPHLRAEAIPGGLSAGARLHLLGGAPGVRVDGGAAWLTGGRDDGPVDLSALPVPGRHNLDNAAVAIALAVHAGAPRARLDVGRLVPLAHRLQAVPSQDGLRWVNDSKATNIDATLMGLGGVPAGALVLLGGEGKDGADYRLLLPALRAGGHRVICFGRDGGLIAEALQTGDPALDILTCPGLQAAVRAAAAQAAPGQTVLLSPACASFDEFRNFEHRGEVFAALVAALPPPGARA